MMNEQFLSRNQYELNQVFLAYRELLSVRSHYVMYMDKDSWELFDPNVGKTIIRHDFKHLKQFRQDIQKLGHDIANVGCMLYFHRPGRVPKQSETWSYKALLKIYTKKELDLLYGKID